MHFILLIPTTPALQSSILFTFAISCGHEKSFLAGMGVQIVGGARVGCLCDGSKGLDSFSNRIMIDCTNGCEHDGRLCQIEINGSRRVIA